MTRLPDVRPSRVVIEPVGPVVDSGRFAAKAALGEPVVVHADVFADGHDAVAAALRWRHISAAGRRSKWTEIPMRPLGNDRWEATFDPSKLGRHEYEISGWSDRCETWRRGTAAKAAADVDVSVELTGGIAMLETVRSSAAENGASDDADLLRGLLDELRAGDTSSLEAPHWVDVFWRHADREPVATLPNTLPVDVDPERGRFSAWYEFFPRSAVAPGTAPATLRDAVDRLDYVADMGFDVLYLPPIHPIGVTNRKGANNTTDASPDDVGSPWGIGGPMGDRLGGHHDVHPDLGTIDDLRALVDAARDRGMALSLDIAFQCTPDHPWVVDHPEWFAKRADGSIQYAENPPKKYQDIYPIDFDTDDWQALWTALADVFRFWFDQGVTIFRVDNPHTKAFPFWEWAIGTLRAEHPEMIFLAEAFTRPRVMERLAKIGFNQSYTYFTWRQSSAELREYFTDLATRTVDFFRPNAWPNTPDILTEQLQHGGRATFVNRAILASMLSPSWGVYGPAFELQEYRAVREGSEEYLDSEKYQLRTWDLDLEHSLAPLLQRLNSIRRSQPALRHLRTLEFHDTDSPGLVCFTKTDPAGEGAPILVVVNLDGQSRHAGNVHIDPATFGVGLGDDDPFAVDDLLGGGTYFWRGWHNFVDLVPGRGGAHVFAVRSLAVDAERDENGHDGPEP